jgi:hypothetical protein
MEFKVEKVVDGFLMNENGVFLKAMAIMNNVIEGMDRGQVKTSTFEFKNITKEKLDKLFYVAGLIASTHKIMTGYVIKKIPFLRNTYEVKLTSILPSDYDVDYPLYKEKEDIEEENPK